MGNILIVAEQTEGKLKKYSAELAGKAKELAEKLGANVTALLFGTAAAAAEELGSYGMARVLTIEHPKLAHATSQGYAHLLCQAIVQEKPAIVLASATPLGKDLLARAAMRLKVGLAMDCIDLRIDAGKLAARRPIFAGKAQVDVVPAGEPQMATARPNSFIPPLPGSGAAESVALSLELPDLPAEIREVKAEADATVDLTEAERIVSGGRSLASAENFKIIRDLAAAFGAAVGASRAAVDAGYISHDHQVGQTGKTVNPTLYIACGISGAIQHLAGMRTAKIIVAINKDPDAPIFSKADYGIVGDLFEIIPLLTAEANRVLKE